MRLATFIVLGAAWLGCVAATAAEFSRSTIEVEGNKHKKILMKGPILAGDAKRLLKLLGDEAIGNDQTVVVSLDSNGGDFQEGIRMALGIREKKAQTIVEADASCLSACAVAFLGGSAYGDEDSIFIARSIAPTAKLGFHAPYLRMNGNFDQASIEAAYDHAIETIVNFVEISDNVGLTSKVAASLMKPKRKELLTINNVDFLGVVQVAVQDVENVDHVTASMLRDYCANHVGWVNRVSSIEPYRRALEIIKDFEWDPVKSSFRLQDETGEELVRTVIPIRLEAEGTLYWCVVDHSSNGNLFCHGYYYSESLADILALAGKGNGNTLPENPDFACFILATIEPTKGFSRSIGELAWEMVPPDTPIDKISDVLAGYQAREPALVPK